MIPATPAGQRRNSDGRWRRAHDIVLVSAGLALDLSIWGFDGQTRAGFAVQPWVIVMSGVAASAPLLVRRRHPWTAFWSVWVYSVLWGVLIPTYEPFVGLLIATYQFARHTEAALARRPLPLLLVPWTINTYNAVVASGEKPDGVVVTAAIWFALGASVWLAGRAGYRTQRLYELQTANQAIEAAMRLQQHQLSLARELHDIVAHSVSAVMFQAAGARAAADSSLDPGLDDALQAIESSSIQATRELRRLLGLLHPEADTGSVEAVASLADLDQLIGMTRNCGVAVQITEQGVQSELDPSVDHTAYRVLQESLANVMKHGGLGARAEISFDWNPHSLRIAVRSWAGLESRPMTTGGPTGFGLSGLQERVSGVGGQLDAGPGPDSFLVVADLPVEAAPSGTSGSTPRWLS